MSASLYFAVLLCAVAALLFCYAHALSGFMGRVVRARREPVTGRISNAARGTAILVLALVLIELIVLRIEYRSYGEEGRSSFIYPGLFYGAMILIFAIPFCYGIIATAARWARETNRRMHRATMAVSVIGPLLFVVMFPITLSFAFFQARNPGVLLSQFLKDGISILFTFGLLCTGFYAVVLFPIRANLRLVEACRFARRRTARSTRQPDQFRRATQSMAGATPRTPHPKDASLREHPPTP